MRNEPEIEREILRRGHREYVGGMWDPIGKLQFQFMVDHGLLPHHILWDVACGCLRAGRLFIEYLNPWRYHGIDASKLLLDFGRLEVPRSLWDEREPVLVCDDTFNFTRIQRDPDYVLIHSLFTHVPADMVHQCLRNLRPHGGTVFATFGLGDSKGNPKEPGDHKTFTYTKDEMVAFGPPAGWRANYYGKFRHPRGQVMVEYVPDDRPLTETDLS